MRIAKIQFHNWMRFRGEHALELDAKAYAVVARGTHDPERSNWLGKSSFLEAIDFALWGRHRFRTEDEWISNGEPIGEVRLTLDDGSTILRHRERGKRTTLHFRSSDVPNGAMSDEAQRIVAETVGFGSEDFLVTSYFQQRQMARLILADPGTRMDLVSGWLRLGPLERCDDRIKAEVATLANQIAQADAQIASIAELERSALDGATRDVLVASVASAEIIVEKRRSQREAAQTAVALNLALISARSKVDDFEALIRDGKALRAELDADDGPGLEAAHSKARAEEMETAARARSARTAMGEKRDLSRGEFDGRCPVAGIDCPAKSDINQDRKRGLKLFEDARTISSEAELAYLFAKQDEQTARARLQEFQRKESRLQTMREQAARMEIDYERAKRGGEPEDPIVLRQRLDDAGGKYDSAVGVLNLERSRISAYDAHVVRRAGLESGLGVLRARLSVLREAAVVFGKQGAQRRVAEGALGEIESGANAMLREASMDLSVSVRWSREGSGPARACDACGNPFPASVKVKVCPRCAAARGPNLINKLDFVLSDRSGAAEDLGGVALQLSASSWLRDELGSRWETAMLDEPFGQLDGANRRALGRHLAALLGGRYGFAQAFVVAHSPDVLGALPGRLEIEGGPTGSTIRVVA